MRHSNSLDSRPEILAALDYEPEQRQELELPAKDGSTHAALLWADPDAPSDEALEIAHSLAGKYAASSSPISRRTMLTASALLGDPMGTQSGHGARTHWLLACKAALGDGDEMPIHGAATAAGDDLAWALCRSVDPEAFLERLGQACGGALWEPKDIVGTVEPYQASLAERIACKACGPFFCSGSIGGIALFWSVSSRLGRLGRWARGHAGLHPARCAGALRDSASLCHFPAQSRKEDKRLLSLALGGLFGADLDKLRLELWVLGAFEGSQALAESEEELEKTELLEHIQTHGELAEDGSSGSQGRL